MDQVTDAQPRQALQYDGRLGELYRIFLVNLLLTIITLGIYRFWAITRWRRYFWSRMVIAHPAQAGGWTDSLAANTN